MILMLGACTELARGEGNIGEVTPNPSFPALRIVASGSHASTASSQDKPGSQDAPPRKSKEPRVSESFQPQTSPSQPKHSILVPENPDKDNGQVIVAYKSKLEETQTLMRTIDESQLTKEQHDTLVSIHSFLEKAQEAFSQDDMSMAVNLAEKAHTLTKEIVKNSPKP